MKSNKEYQILFIHPKDGNITFSAEINSLNGSKMYWFSNNNGMCVGTLTDIKTIVKHIRTKFKVINDEFNFIKKVLKKT